MATRWERDRAASGPLVTGFSGNGFKIDGTPRPGGVLLTPTSAHDWVAPAPEAITTQAIASLLALDPLPEFILLGTGAATTQPPRAFAEALERQGIGLEAMDSRAAARAWGVLRAEDRWIAAALMPLYDGVVDTNGLRK